MSDVKSPAFPFESKDSILVVSSDRYQSECMKDWQKAGLIGVGTFVLFIILAAIFVVILGAIGILLALVIALVVYILLRKQIRRVKNKK